MNLFFKGLFLCFISISSTTSFAISEIEIVEYRDGDSLGVVVEKSDFKKGMSALGKEMGKALAKDGSVFLEGLASIGIDEGIDEDCNDGDCDVRPSKSGPPVGDLDSDGDGIPELSFFIDHDHDSDGDGYGDAIYRRYVDNVFSDFIYRSAEVQDHNTTRSNRSVIMVEGSNTMNDFDNDLVAIFKRQDSGENYASTLSERMAALKLDGRYSYLLQRRFFNAIQNVYLEELVTRKKRDFKKSDALYEKAALKSNVPVKTLREIIRRVGILSKRALIKGETVDIPVFGSIEISRRIGRLSISDLPLDRKTDGTSGGKEIKIAAKNVVKFKAGSELSKKVN